MGLGNPGPRYAFSRHNVGWRVLDALAGSAVFRRHKTPNQVCRLADMLLAKPRSYVNLSGGAVQSLLAYERPRAFLVVHDDLDIAFGRLRIKDGGGSGGHNGLKSIIGVLGGGFHRLRFGVGRPPPGCAVSDFVLANFSSGEQALVGERLSLAAAVVEVMCRQGPESARQFLAREQSD